MSFAISRLRRVALGLGLALLALGAAAEGSLGMSVLPGRDGNGPVTVFHPSSSAAAPVQRGPFTLEVAWQGVPKAGNRRLIVISHGSGGAPWPLADLARAFVDAGYTVALPEHRGDNYRDQKLEGPETWKLRPGEVTAAIDLLQADPRFGPLLQLDQVGVYGTSAGGLTALTLAGAQWSPARFQRHCRAHLREDFPACVGLIVTLRGTLFDDVKILGAGWVYRWLFRDETLQGHADPRIRAVIASVPMAAPIDPASLAHPRAAIGLVSAGQDQWLQPRFHVEAVHAACPACEMVAELPQAGHGSLFSPWPQPLATSLSPMLVDPPGFDRSSLPAVYARMVAFFQQHLAPAAR